MDSVASVWFWLWLWLLLVVVVVVVVRALAVPSSLSRTCPSTLYTSSRAGASFPTFKLPNTRPATPDPIKQATQPQIRRKDIRPRLVTNIYKQIISIAKRALLGKSRRRVGARPSVSYESLRKVTAESTVFYDWT